jgi:addiction module HigA family antidote
VQAQRLKKVAHPGTTLKAHMRAAGLSAAALSRYLNVPTNRITSILNGQRAITGDTALRLSHFFQKSPDFWLGLQTEYDLHLAEKEKGREILGLPTIKSEGEVADRRSA